MTVTALPLKVTGKERVAWSPRCKNMSKILTNCFINLTGNLVIEFVNVVPNGKEKSNKPRFPVLVRIN